MGNPTPARCSFVAPPRFCDASKGNDKAPQWHIGLLARGRSVVAVALANKMARIIWRCSPRAGNRKYWRGKQRGERLSREKAEWTDRRDAGQRRGAQLRR